MLLLITNILVISCLGLTNNNCDTVRPLRGGNGVHFKKCETTEWMKLLSREIYCTSVPDIICIQSTICANVSRLFLFKLGLKPE